MIKAAGDDRAMFYSGIGGGIRKIETDVISGFKDGLSIVKWQNIRSDGQPTHHTEYPDNSAWEKMQPKISIPSADAPTVPDLFRQ